MVSPVGKIFKPHGYKGEMNVELYYPADIFKNPDRPFFISVDNIIVPFFVQSIGGGTLIKSYLKLKGIDSDVEASEFAKKEIFALKSDLCGFLGISEEELERSAQGLEGFEVIDAESGNSLGVIEGMEEGVEYDYLLMKKQESGEVVHIPFVEDFIEEINEDGSEGKKFIVARLPEGFLDL